MLVNHMEIWARSPYRRRTHAHQPESCGICGNGNEVVLRAGQDRGQLCEFEDRTS